MSGCSQSITINLTYDEAVQVDRALAMRQSLLEEIIEDRKHDDDGIERTMLEVQVCNAVVHKLAPIFAQVHNDHPEGRGDRCGIPVHSRDVFATVRLW